MMITRYFNAETGIEIQNPTIMNTPPSAHCVEEQDDGTFSCGIYHGHATPQAAIDALKAGLAVAYARIDAELANKNVIGHCHYCGQSIYTSDRAVFGFFGEYQCEQCQ